MKYEEAFARLQQIDRQLVMLEHISAALEWDQEISLTQRAVEERANQLGWLAEQRHSLASSEELGAYLAALDEREARSEFEASLIRHHKREYERKCKLPADLVSAISIQASKSRSSWVEARKASDWSLFEREFSVMVDLIRRKAEYLREDGQSLYDALLGEFEEGMDSKTVSFLFDSIEGRLSEMVQKYSSLKVEDSFLYLDYPIEGQQQFANQVLKDMGFDFTRGSCSVSVHPFTTTIACDDIRITTRYTDPSVMDSFASSIHEAGHALYEMRASSGILKGTSVAGGASYGMHESQSRLWENMIAKSPEFWEYYYPLFKKIFPSQTENVDLATFVRAVNKVERTCIRVNADELSYTLHIILRYNLERRILDGQLAISDIPEAWNNEFERLFGFRPKTDAEGVLQDVHWSSGDFGYFPTYALGNLYGAQIYRTMQQMLDVPSLLKEGKLEKITAWLGKQVYEKGALQNGRRTMEEASSTALDATVFASYLENKFSRLFG